MKRFLLCLLILLIVPNVVFAADYKDEYNDYLNEYDFSFFEDSVDNDTYELLEELGIENFDYEAISAMEINDLVNILIDIINSRSRSSVNGFLMVIGFVVISALIRSLKSNDDELNNTFTVASSTIISVALIAKISGAITICCSSVKIVADFIYAFVPTFCAIVATGGGITSSFSTNVLLLTLSQGLSFISSNVIMPVINCFLALGICSGLNTEINLSSLINGLKHGFIKCVSFVAGAFVSVLSIKTTISAKADILGIRSIRFVINSVVPVIGPSISEGLLSIQSYSSLIKSSVGIVGIIAVVFMFMPAVVELVFWRIALSVAGIVSEAFGENAVSKVISAFKDALLMINVVLVMSMLTTIISFGILIAAKTA